MALPKLRYTKRILSGVLFLCLASTLILAQSLQDVDGNVYKTVTIGTQIWMAENLKTTKYNDSTVIPVVIDNKAWKALSTPAYCWYNNNDTANKDIYGGLYNWFTVSTKKLCPKGWHIPSYGEWATMTKYLGPAASGVGWKLKESGTTHWESPNNRATNESGFAALPGGERRFNGTFDFIGNLGQWWIFPNYYISYVPCQLLWNKGNSLVSSFTVKRAGLSVRCLKDN